MPACNTKDTKCLSYATTVITVIAAFVGLGITSAVLIYVIQNGGDLSKVKEDLAEVKNHTSNEGVTQPTNANCSNEFQEISNEFQQQLDVIKGINDGLQNESDKIKNISSEFKQKLDGLQEQLLDINGINSEFQRELENLTSIRIELEREINELKERVNSSIKTTTDNYAELKTIFIAGLCISSVILLILITAACVFFWRWRTARNEESIIQS